MTQLSIRELATTLAALRYWQQDLIVNTDANDRAGDGEPIVESFDGLTPLSAEEIDTLSERLNDCVLESPFEAMCREVAESAESWGDCSDLRETVAVFKELGRRCREELAAAGRNDKPCRGYVLYDFDQWSLMTTTVFTSYQEAGDAADRLSDVLVAEIPVPARTDSADELPEDEGRCDCEAPGTFCSSVSGILARVEHGRLAPGAAVERCNACERFPSDEAALSKLVERGIAPRPHSDLIG